MKKASPRIPYFSGQPVFGDVEGLVASVKYMRS